MERQFVCNAAVDFDSQATHLIRILDSHEHHHNVKMMTEDNNMER